MILRIVIYIILAINMFIYGLENNIYFIKIKYPIILALICISLIMYMLYQIRFKNNKMLFCNILYTIGISWIYPPALVMLLYIVIEYIQLKEYEFSVIFIAIFIYIFIAMKINIGYTNISLGAIATVFSYEVMKYENKINLLIKSNYELKDKNYNLEDRKSRENKVSYQNLESVKIEERNMISQKLHDKIGHTLAGSIMQLEALKIIMVKDKEKGELMLDSIIDNLRIGMNDIRETLRNIKPEQSKLNINNLKLMLGEFSNKTNIETNLIIAGDLNEINLVYWKCIVESLNEILTNSMKYSNGDLIVVEISVLNKIIRVHIKDNGCYQGKIKKGMGLLGIEERIISLGGSVNFDNEDGFSNLIILNR